MENHSQLYSVIFLFPSHIHRHSHSHGKTRHVTLGDRAFPVAAARAWNALPASVRAASGAVLPGSEDSLVHGIIWLSRLTVSSADRDCLLLILVQCPCSSFL